jgi:hypothetical protein
MQCPMLHNSLLIRSGGNHLCSVSLDSSLLFLRLSNSILMRRRNLHYWVTVFLLAALIPVLRSQHLPLRFDWITVSVAYWVILGVQSIFLAVLLACIGTPQILSPLIDRYRRNWLRLVAVAAYFAVLAWATTVTKSLVLSVVTVALLELYDRKGARDLSRTAGAVLVPAAYLFLGFLLVLAYNCAIVSVRYAFLTDPALAGIDRWLLQGHAVWELTHWGLRVFPISFFKFLEFIYFGMFPQIGAAILLVALWDGRARALLLVGTVLLSYYFALALFYLWPALGPFTVCPDHFSRFPPSLAAYTIQKTLMVHALALYHHDPFRRIPIDYFIALPSMHIVQPLIVIWFLRRWKRMVIVLAIYDVVLVAAILFLEMHYVIDLIVGILVAALSIAICAGPLRQTGRTRDNV